jgi:hypothetical protein
MPRTNAQAKQKTPVQANPPAKAKTPASSPSRRRPPQSPHETPPLPTAESGREVHPGPPSILPAPGPQEEAQGVPTARPTPREAHGAPGPPEEHLGMPHVSLNPQVVEDLAAVWPDLQAMLAWWQERQHLVQQSDAPDRKLVRQTYHVEQRFIDAVKREADRTGESYAAVVNRAFAQYFARR